MSKRENRRATHLLTDPAPPSPTAWAIPLLLVVVTVLALFPLCGFEFSSWDDLSNVAHNDLLNPPTLSHLWACWTKPQLAIYIPLTYTVWSIVALVARTDAPDPSGIWLNPYLFHTANLVVHIAGAFFAFALLKRLVGKAWPAAVGALLFAVHPLQVESVGWIAGLKDVLYGTLSIAALWQYVVSLQSEGSKRRLPYSIATAAFGLALLSKPSAMAVPLLAAVIARCLCKTPLRQIVVTLGPWLAMAVPIAIIAKVAQPVTAVYDGGKFWLRPLIATDALAYYACKIILPLKLALQYDHYPQIVIERRWLDWTWIVPAVLALFGALYWKKKPWLLTGLALIPAATLPVLGLVPFQYEQYSVVSDHYMYLAMLGPALLAAFAVTLLPKRIAIIASVAVLMLLAIRSNVQTWVWRDTQSLFQHELTVNPRSAVALDSLAMREIVLRQPQQAVAYAQRAVDVRPDFGQAWETLGSTLSAVGRSAEAAAAFKRAYDLADSDDNAALSAGHYGAAMGQLGNRVEAEAYLRRAVTLDPTLDEAHSNLAVLYASAGRFSDAIPEAEAAVRLSRNNGQYHQTLGILLDQSGHRDRAVEEFQRALQLDPNLPIARRGLAGPLNGRPAPKR